MKPSTKRKEPELDDTLSAAVEVKRSKADRCFLKNQSKRRRSDDSPTQITPRNKRIISRDGNFSLRLSEVDELGSPPCSSFEAPSFAASAVPDRDQPEASAHADSAERFILDVFNKYVATGSESHSNLKRAQQAYEASPAPVKRLVAQTVGVSAEALREKIYGDVSVYG